MGKIYITTIKVDIYYWKMKKSPDEKRIIVIGRFRLSQRSLTIKGGRMYKNTVKMTPHGLLSRDLFHFLGKNHQFLLLFLCYLYFGTFFVHVVSKEESELVNLLNDIIPRFWHDSWCGTTHWYPFFLFI